MGSTTTITVQAPSKLEEKVLRENLNYLATFMHTTAGKLVYEAIIATYAQEFARARKAAESFAQGETQKPQLQHQRSKETVK